MDYTKRVKYISPIVPPSGISKYKYYEIAIDDKNKKVVVNGDKKQLEYSLDNIKKLFVPEIGTWDNLFINSIEEVDIEKKEIDNKENIKDKLKKYL